MALLAVVLAVIFSALALLHMYWALGGRWGIGAALPTRDGMPVFTPGPVVTILVAGVLAGFAAVALLFRLDQTPFSLLTPYAGLLGVAAGGTLVLRAVGEFKYVGFFKRVRGTKFATYDSWLFSPFCLLSGGGFLALAWQGI